MKKEAKWETKIVAKRLTYSFKNGNHTHQVMFDWNGQSGWQIEDVSWLKHCKGEFLKKVVEVWEELKNDS